MGGWGLKHLLFFGNALLYKSLYRGIFGDGPWRSLVRTKYLRDKPVEFWYRKWYLGTRNGLMIWNSFRKVHPYFMENFCWTLYTGSYIFIAFDSIISGRGITFPLPLLHDLHRVGVFTWDKLIKGWSRASPIWKEGEELHLPRQSFPLWLRVKTSLDCLGISRSGTRDNLVWTIHKLVSVKNIYADMISVAAKNPPPLFPLCYWKAQCPMKMITFSWLLFRNKNLSWENLQRKSWQGPSRCSMCRNALETNLHMFFQCPTSHTI